MSIMHIPALIITAIGVVSSVFTYGMNIHLLRNYKKKKDDIMIFYCRFVVDVLIGFVITFYLLFVIFYSLFTEQLSEYHNFIIYITIPTTSLGATRSIVTLSIYMERMVAVYAPIFFHKHKHIFSPFPIFAIAASFGLSNPIVLFGFCRYDFDIPKWCAAFGCAIHKCFRTYWSTHKLIIFTLIFSFSILVCLKLFVMKFGKTRESRHLSRANRLSIIDAIIIFCSDFFPSVVASNFISFSFHDFGPFGAVLQNFGLAIESFLFYRMLLRKSSSLQPSDSAIHAARKKEDIMIFYCRFVVDVLIGFVITFYLSFVIFYSLFTEQLSEYHNFIIYITIPTSTLGATRSIVTLSIYMERFMAVYAPIFFHKHKHIFSLYLIFAIAALFGLTNPIVLFGFCSYDFDFPKTCAVFGCAINTCFRNYWSTHKLIIFSLIFSFSLLVCLKLFVMKFGKTRESRRLSRANRLSIIDAIIIFCSDFFPSVVASNFISFSFHNFGPFGAVLQNFGLAIESFLFYRMLLRKSSSFQPSDSTVHAARVKACTF